MSKPYTHISFFGTYSSPHCLPPAAQTKVRAYKREQEGARGKKKRGEGRLNPLFSSVSWFDPNSVRQNDVNSGVCRTAWSWDGVTKHNATLDGSDPVASYNSCWHDDLTYFKVAVPAFWHPANFSLELAHRYKDDELSTCFFLPLEFLLPLG